MQFFDTVFQPPFPFLLDVVGGDQEDLTRVLSVAARVVARVYLVDGLLKGLVVFELKQADTFRSQNPFLRNIQRRQGSPSTGLSNRMDKPAGMKKFLKSFDEKFL